MQKLFLWVHNRNGHISGLWFFNRYQALNITVILKCNLPICKFCVLLIRRFVAVIGILIELNWFQENCCMSGYYQEEGCLLISMSGMRRYAEQVESS